MSNAVMYFAYGSNMSSARLRYRVPGAEPVGLARLPSHRLRFHKRSDKDGSGKCDVEFTGQDADIVIGVLFSVPRAQLDDLHRAEGRGYGYDDHQVEVTIQGGDLVMALTYKAAASHRDPSLVPFIWYWDFVSSGALEHGLPADYISTFINSAQPIADPDHKRDREERARIAKG